MPWRGTLLCSKMQGSPKETAVSTGEHRTMSLVASLGRDLKKLKDLIETSKHFILFIYLKCFRVRRGAAFLMLCLNFAEGLAMGESPKAG